ncbi:trmB [Symbiodinium microadriaticum]|nr:trmB [Symbiodinium microadriaticum]
MARRARSSSDRRSRSRSRSRSSSSRSRKSKSRSSSKSSKSKKSRKSRKASSQSGSRRRRSRSRSRSRRSPSRSRRNRRARARGGRRRERSRSRSRRNRSSKRRSKSPAAGAKSASASATSEAYGAGAYSLYGWGSGYRSWNAWPESSYYSGYSAYQGYQYGQRDYATEKPENYMAFVQQHVREGKNGTEVILSNNMCQDRHVDDLLLCIESWLARQYGRSGAQPWQLGTVDLSLNGLSDDSVARIADRLRQLHVRVRCLDLTGNKAATKGLAALEAYLWNCSEPFQEISLADNEILVEAGSGEENPVSSFLRCLYNHPNYPRKTSSDAGVLIHPLVLRLGKNRIGDLPGLLRDIRSKVGGRARFCRSAEAYKEPESEEFLSVHIADLPESGEAEDPETAEDSAWKRRQRRRKAKELSAKDEDEKDPKESPKSEESEEEKPQPRKTEESKEGKKKKAKKENGKTKKKKKKRSKRNVSEEVQGQENGKEQTQTGPGSEAETEEGEEENSDEVAEAADATELGVASEPEAVEPEVEEAEEEPEVPSKEAEGQGSSQPSKPARTFSPSALSSEDQARLKKETAERLRLMEGLVESIGESALGKLAELTVRLLVSGKRSEDMMSELKPFVGKQRASELVEWMDEHCQSGVSASETAESELVAGVAFRPQKCRPSQNSRHHDSTFVAEDGTRIAYRLYRSADAEAKQAQEGRLLVSCYFHANAELCTDLEGEVKNFFNSGFALVLCPEFRGYAWSEGKPSLKFLYTDCEAFMQALPSILEAAGVQAEGLQLILHGRSLGSACAIHLASLQDERVGGLVVESGVMDLLALPMVMQLGMMMPQVLQALRAQPCPLKMLEEIRQAMNDRSFRLGTAGKALIAGGLLCLKGSVPTFAVFPAHPTVASKGQVSGAFASRTAASGASGTGAGVGFLSLPALGLAGVSMAIFRRTGGRAAKAVRREPDARRRPAKEDEEVRETSVRRQPLPSTGCNCKRLLLACGTAVATGPSRAWPLVVRLAVSGQQRLKTKRVSPASRRHGFIRTNKEILAAKSPAELGGVLQTFLKEKRTLNSVNLATILYKAAKMDPEEVFSEGRLKFLARSLRSGLLLDGRQLANSLYGLQRMHEATEGVAELLSALALQVEAAAQRAEVLETRALSNALYGLQGFSSSRQRTALPALLRALANWAKAAQAQSPEPRGFSAQGLGMALYGLQGISEEAEELLQALLPYVRASPLDGQAVGNALYGLQSLSSDFEVVRRLLGVFASKLKSFDGKLTEQEVSNALYGLQFMDPSLPEVAGVVEALVAARRTTETSPSQRQRQQRSRHPVNPLQHSQPRLPSSFLEKAFPSPPGEGARYWLDLGCDTGSFVRGVARRHPELRVLGLELRAHAVAFAKARARQQRLENAAFLQGNANVELAELLKQLRESGGQVQTVSINFPDPHLLPPDRDRRVVRGSLVELLAQHLPAEAEVLFQSDLALLVDEARSAFSLHGCFRVTPWVREDLVATERQKVVRRRGLVVHKARLERSRALPAHSLEQDVDKLLEEMRASS